VALSPLGPLLNRHLDRVLAFYTDRLERERRSTRILPS
jgi:hypothetical protein